eukprot:5837040-Amphidinium_carterae.2
MNYLAAMCVDKHDVSVGTVWWRGLHPKPAGARQEAQSQPKVADRDGSSEGIEAEDSDVGALPEQHKQRQSERVRWHLLLGIAVELEA